MRRIKLILLIPLLILALTLKSASPVRAVSNRAGSVADLWLDISLGPPLIEWFNRVARPADIARVDHVERIGLLEQVQVGRKLVVFKSAAEAERLMPAIADQVDIVGYNLEHGPANPTAEQANPVESAKRMRDLARQYDLSLAFGPDHRFALSDGAAIAPYVDIFVLQVQRVQTEPAAVRDFVLPLVAQLRQANPDLEISVQVRTEGDVAALVDLIDSMKETLDGVSILTSPETVPVAEALVDALQTGRAGNAAQPSNATPAAASGNDDVSSAPAGPAIEEIRPPLNQNEPGPMTQNVGLFWIVTMAGAFMTGAIGGGLAATFICRARR